MSCNNESDNGLLLATEVLCQFALNKLPDDYRMELIVETGEVSLTVYDPDGNDIHYDCERAESGWRCAIQAAYEHSRRCDR